MKKESKLIVIQNGKQQELSVPIENCHQMIYEFLEVGSIVIEDQYQTILSEGIYQYDDNLKNLKICIPKQIDSASVTLAYEIIEKLKHDSKFKNKYIYNYREDDYDYYHESQAKLRRIDNKMLDSFSKTVENHQIQDLVDRIKKGENVEQNEQVLLSFMNNKREVNHIFLYYCKEKLNLLTEQEKEMFQNYREFDLERLLTSDVPIEYPLNNDGAGCITIFEDEVISSTTTKMQHSGETKYHLKKYGLGDISDVSQAHIEFHFIEIQIYKDTLVIYTPNDLNEYQKEQLLSILEQVKQIEINHHEKIDVHIDRFQQEETYSTNIDDVIMFVNEIEIKVNSK